MTPDQAGTIITRALSADIPMPEGADQMARAFAAVKAANPAQRAYLLTGIPEEALAAPAAVPMGRHVGLGSPERQEVEEPPATYLEPGQQPATGYQPRPYVPPGPRPQIGFGGPGAVTAPRPGYQSAPSISASRPSTTETTAPSPPAPAAEPTAPPPPIASAGARAIAAGDLGQIYLLQMADLQGSIDEATDPYERMELQKQLLETTTKYTTYLHGLRPTGAAGDPYAGSREARAQAEFERAGLWHGEETTYRAGRDTKADEQAAQDREERKFQYLNGLNKMFLDEIMNSAGGFAAPGSEYAPGWEPGGEAARVFGGPVRGAPAPTPEQLGQINPLAAALARYGR